MNTKRGIFCIETSHWNHGGTQQPSVEKLLELIESTRQIPYIHRDFSTKDELEFLLTQATQKAFNAYPIIYLASHGGKRRIEVRRKVTRNLPTDVVELDEIAEFLKGRGTGKILFVSACGLMDCDLRHLKSFLSKTGIKALIGYKRNVPWIESAQLELGLLAEIASRSSHMNALKAACSSISEANRSLIKSLELRTVPNLFP